MERSLSHIEGRKIFNDIAAWTKSCFRSMLPLEHPSSRPCMTAGPTPCPTAIARKYISSPIIDGQGGPLCDYSVQVLAILELLINENRAAKDIVATPSVRAVQ